jgi:hypothetical protein
MGTLWGSFTPARHRSPAASTLESALVADGGETRRTVASSCWKACWRSPFQRTAGETIVRAMAVDATIRALNLLGFALMEARDRLGARTADMRAASG